MHNFMWKYYILGIQGVSHPSSISILNGCSICNILSVYNRLNNNKKVFIILRIFKILQKPKTLDICNFAHP